MALVAERGTPVQLTFAPGRVTVGAATQGQARARETVPADFTGDEPSIAFSPQYLLDGVVAATATHPDEAAAGGRPGQAAVHQPGQAGRDHAGAPAREATSGTWSSRSASASARCGSRSGRYGSARCCGIRACCVYCSVEPRPEPDGPTAW